MVQGRLVSRCNQQRPIPLELVSGALPRTFYILFDVARLRRGMEYILTHLDPLRPRKCSKLLYSLIW
jgi:hypothetical protein